MRFNSVSRSYTRFGLTPAASLKELAMLVNWIHTRSDRLDLNVARVPRAILDSHTLTGCAAPFRDVDREIDDWSQLNVVHSMIFNRLNDWLAERLCKTIAKSCINGLEIRYLCWSTTVSLHKSLETALPIQHYLGILCSISSHLFR